jgi:TRAP-type C4-dicarboxylate transport system permease small subunit
VGMIIYLVPRHHKQVAIVAASLVSAAAIGFLGYVSFQVANAELEFGPDGWYRHILDMLSIIFGAIAGAWLAYGNQKRKTRA